MSVHLVRVASTGEELGLHNLTVGIELHAKAAPAAHAPGDTSRAFQQNLVEGDRAQDLIFLVPERLDLDRFGIRLAVLDTKRCQIGFPGKETHEAAFIHKSSCDQ